MVARIERVTFFENGALESVEFASVPNPTPAEAYAAIEALLAIGAKAWGDRKAGPEIKDGMARFSYDGPPSFEGVDRYMAQMATKMDADKNAHQGVVGYGVWAWNHLTGWQFQGAMPIGVLPTDQTVITPPHFQVSSVDMEGEEVACVWFSGLTSEHAAEAGAAIAQLVASYQAASND